MVHDACMIMLMMPLNLRFLLQDPKDHRVRRVESGVVRSTSVKLVMMSILFPLIVPLVPCLLDLLAIRFGSSHTPLPAEHCTHCSAGSVMGQLRRRKSGEHGSEQ